MSEVWKDVVGFEEYFKVSNTGKVWSKRTDRELRQCKIKSGYMTIVTRIGGRSGKVYCLRVHRLVAEAFIPNPEGKPYVNHINSVRNDNALSNLEWVTAQENVDHALEFGNMSRVRPNSSARLFSDDEVAFIRKAYRSRHSEFGARALARRFNVCHTTILSILNRTRYR